MLDAFGPHVVQALVDWAAQHDTTLHHPRPLTNGQTDAPVVAVYEQPAGRSPRTLVLKVCQDDDVGDLRREAGRHLAAQAVSKPFAEAHLVGFAYEPLRVAAGEWVTFQELAGGSLTDTSPLSQLQDEVTGRGGVPEPRCDVADIVLVCGTVVRSVLGEWAPARGATMDVVTFLRWHLGGRHEVGGSLHAWVAAEAPELLDPSARWIQLPHAERLLPNPLALARDPSLSAHTTLWALIGPAHGDLHPGNVLVPVRPQIRPWGFRLVDLSRFEREAPLSRDPVHLTLSAVTRHLDEMSPSQQDALIRLLVDPTVRSSGSTVPSPLQRIIEAIVDEGSSWAANLGLTDEWRAQTTLSLVACALVFTGRRTTLDRHREWFLRLAAEAAHQHVARARADVAESLRAPRQATPIEVRSSAAPRATCQPEAPLVVGSEARALPFPERSEPPGAGPGDGDQLGGRTTRRRRPVPAELLRASDELAERVKEQWEQAATGRRLLSPGPIRVRWAKSARPVVGPLSDALGDAASARGVTPLPGATEPTPESLRHGEVAHLLAVYCGLPTGRLVIMGSPGAGKTAAAIRLVLDLLQYRLSGGDAERAGVAVPVILTPLDWDPERQPVGDWLVQRLASDYSLRRPGEHHTGTAARLVRAGLVALVLDGLDDMPEEVRAAALRALDEQDRLRVVVVGRSVEMEVAAAEGHLSAAVAVELQPVEPSEAADYLVRCGVDPLPPDWQRLVDHLRARPTSPVAQALDSPLMLALVRDTYRRSGDDVDELTDTSRFPTGADVEDHLLDRVLPIAYGPRPGPTDPPYSLEQARRWLGHMAYRMHLRNTRDLAWWCTPWCLSGWRRGVGTSLVSGLLSGVLFAVLGYVGDEPVMGFVGGLACGPTATAFNAFVVMRYEDRGRPSIGFRIALGYLLATLLTGLLTGVALVGIDGVGVGLGAGLGVGLVLGVPVVLHTVRRLRFNVRPTAAVGSPLTPEACWRQDIRHSLVFAWLVSALVGITAALVCLLVREPLTRVMGAVAIEALVMPVFALTFSAWAKTTLAAFQLWLQGRCPVRLVRFLEDARERNVLRTAGPVYQFRHARLQDVLARSYAETHGLPYDAAERSSDP